MHKLNITNNKLFLSDEFNVIGYPSILKQTSGQYCCIEENLENSRIKTLTEISSGIEGLPYGQVDKP